MKIKNILSQSRRDFYAIYECENCGHETEKSPGYDDKHFHDEVIPNMICEKCGEKSPNSYRALSTKYREGDIV